MANVIHVTPAKLTTEAGVFETTANEVKNLTSQMTTTVQALTGRIWSGEAANAYTSKFNGLQGDINKLYQMIVKHSTHLKEIAAEYEKGETEATAESSNLANNIIS